MTKLSAPIQRETTATVFERSQHRPVIVTLQPNNTIALRLKGTQRTYTLPVDQCYELAVKAEIEFNRRAKRRKRARD